MNLKSTTSSSKKKKNLLPRIDKKDRNLIVKFIVFLMVEALEKSFYHGVVIFLYIYTTII